MSKKKASPPTSAWTVFWTPRRQTALIVASLGCIVGLVFGATVFHGFVSFDDGGYIVHNFHVLRGLRWENLMWAFTTTRGALWIPATWLSFMLDAQFWGNNAAGYHLTNVLLHALGAIGLFLALRRLTGRQWPSALAAAIFAVHPTQVESVAWATERKDVLSGLFFMGTLWVYAGYAEHPKSWGRYLAVLALAAIGLMAKATLMTLPMVLLLLDYWPLRRFAGQAAPVGAETSASGDARPSWRERLMVATRLVVEKIPLFAMTAAIVIITIECFGEGTLVSRERFSISWRVGNAILSYGVYLKHFFYPTHLAFVYPRLGPNLPWGQVAATLVGLLAVSGFAVLRRRRFPYLLVGWFWFLGVLVPVIGLLQVGATSVADRFTYLPMIGLAVALAWGVSDAMEQFPRMRTFGIAASIAILAALTVSAFGQVLLWNNNETLWAHTLDCTTDNFLAHVHLGDVYLEQGRAAEAIQQYTKAKKINPQYFTTNFGMALALVGDYANGVQCYLEALKDTPDDPKIYFNLAWIYAANGHRGKAIAAYRRAVQLAPDDREAHNNLGTVLLDDGQYAEALKEFEQALRIGGENPNVDFNLGNALKALGRFDEAALQYRKVLAVSPNDREAKKRLDEALQKQR